MSTLSNSGPAVSCLTHQKSLTYKEAISILQSQDQYVVNSNPPVKPKGGELYLVSSGERDAYLKNWMCDQYKWLFIRV